MHLFSFFWSSFGILQMFATRDKGIIFFANRNSCKVATSEKMLYKFRKLYCYNNLSPNMIIPSCNMKTVLTWQIFDWTSHHKSVWCLYIYMERGHLLVKTIEPTRFTRRLLQGSILWAMVIVIVLFMIILFDVIFRI